MKLLLTSFLFLCFLTSYSQETKVEPQDSTNEELIKVVEVMPRFPGCENIAGDVNCLLYTSPSPRDRQKSRMPSSA